MTVTLARKSLDLITPYKPGKPIEELKRELGLKEVIKLASNENALGPSPRALKAIRKVLRDLNRYPDSDAFLLKKKLASRLGVKESMIIPGNGSDEIILLALRAFVEGGEEVVVANPTFLIYEIASRVAGARVIEVPLKNFRYDLLRMKEAITSRTKMVFIANPDNPTGTYVTRDEVETFLKDLPKEVIVFFDEAYFEFVQEKEYPDTRKYLSKHPVIITRSFSKAYGLAGVRIGYGISSPEIIDYLNRVREPFNVNALAQAAAVAALEDRAHLERTRRLVRSGKTYLYRHFDELGLRYFPSQTNFILVNVGDGKSIYEKLLRFGVIVRDMTAWKMDAFIRVTVGKTEENKRLIRALQKIL